MTANNDPKTAPAEDRFEGNGLTENASRKTQGMKGLSAVVTALPLHL